MTLPEMREPKPLDDRRAKALRTDELYRRFVVSCCDALGVGSDELLERGRGCAQVVSARKFIAWALRERWRLSYPHLARVLNRKDHTTMISSVKRFQRAVDNRERWALELVAACDFIGRSELQVETALESLNSMGAAVQ